MSNWIYVFVIILLFLIVPAGRKVLHVFFGVLYLPLQLFFMWLQKINLGLKDKDPLMYYLSCLIIYPLYAIVIPLSKLFETFHNSMH